MPTPRHTSPQPSSSSVVFHSMQELVDHYGFKGYGDDKPDAPVDHKALGRAVADRLINEVLKEREARKGLDKP